jgi:hypothetical protein
MADTAERPAEELERRVIPGDACCSNGMSDSICSDGCPDTVIGKLDTNVILVTSQAQTSCDMGLQCGSGPVLRLVFST